MVSSKNGSPRLKEVQATLAGLTQIYEKKILPLESAYRYDSFYMPMLSPNEITSKPLVLLLGQYSTGKTTFIENLIGRPYSGSRVGPEPTTDRFVAVMGGREDRVIPGNAAAVQKDKPFTGLAKFGCNFLSKFQVSENDCPILDSITLIDTPGVLSGDKQRKGRSYDFSQVALWFAEHADLILFFFDAHKLDISDELDDIIKVLRPFDEKTRIILNKADRVGKQELMRVYGALMWSLGKAVRTPEVMRVYIGSFDALNADKAAIKTDNDKLLRAEEEDLLKELKKLPLNSATRKVNDIVKRARLAKTHALVISSLRAKMPAVFGKATKQTKLLQDLPEEYARIRDEFRIPEGDFPEPTFLSQKLESMDLCAFPKMVSKLINNIDEALNVDLPLFMQNLPTEGVMFVPKAALNPFASLSVSVSAGAESLWEWDLIPQTEHKKAFQALLFNSNNQSSSTIVETKIAGRKCHEFFIRSGLPNADLGHIWKLSDRDHDGALDEIEFIVMMHLVKLAVSGIQIPQTLPATIFPSPTSRGVSA